jgi:hypothetical protein
MEILVFVGLMILIIILAVASPVIIHLDSIRSNGKIDGRFSIGWLIFLTSFAIKERRIEISIFGRRIYRFKQKDKTETQNQKSHPLNKTGKIKKTKKTPPAGVILDIARLALRFIREIFDLFTVKCLDIHVTFGLGDPAYTGILIGYLYAIRGAIRSGHNIGWTADFTRKVLDWNMKFEASLKPIMLLFPLAKLATSKQFVVALKGFFFTGIEKERI